MTVFQFIDRKEPFRAPIKRAVAKKATSSPGPSSPPNSLVIDDDGASTSSAPGDLGKMMDE